VKGANGENRIVNNAAEERFNMLVQIEESTEL